MRSKIGFILTLPIVFLILLFGIDLIHIQLTYISLDSISTFVSENISKNGTISSELKQYVKEKVDAELYTVEDEIIEDGQLFEFYLKKEIYPLTLNKKQDLIIKRFAVIKYYN